MEIIEQKELVHPVAVQMSLTRAFKARKDLNNMIQRMGQTLRRIQGFPEDFELPPTRQRWMKLIGNSVTVPVIDKITKAIVATGVFDGNNA